ncbi:MAG: hypothetical protein IPK26_31245 [Planctomycetes bacterium]|nr:hypothetical protein [Planctomycetota bacterium]
MARLMFGVAALFFGSAAIAPALQGASSCDLLIHYTARGLNWSCPDQECAMCGVGPTAAVQGRCAKLPGMVAGVPAIQCECRGKARSSEDTCFAQVVFDPIQGPTVNCQNNQRLDCDCFPGFLPPRGVACMQVAAFPVVPTQVCQCIGGDETFDNGD